MGYLVIHSNSYSHRIRFLLSKLFALDVSVAACQNFVYRPMSPLYLDILTASECTVVHLILKIRSRSFQPSVYCLHKSSEEALYIGYCVFLCSLVIVAYSRYVGNTVDR